jgi:hypothetical protein
MAMSKMNGLIVWQAPLPKQLALEQFSQLGFARFGAGSIFLYRFNGIFCGSFALIALGPKNRFTVIFEIGDIFAGFVLFDFKIMRHVKSLPDWTD